VRRSTKCSEALNLFVTDARLAHIKMRGQRDAIIRRLSEKCGGETGEGEAGAAELTR
jgi:hypothetical protein